MEFIIDGESNGRYYKEKVGWYFGVKRIGNLDWVCDAGFVEIRFMGKFLVVFI